MRIMPKHLIIILTVVALISMLTMMGDNVEYLSIVAERSNVAKSVSLGRADFETLRVEYENCIYRIQKLEKRSDYGRLISNIDSMNAGRLVNSLLILMQVVITLIAAFVLGVAAKVKLQKEYKRAKRMIRRANARKKHSGKYATTAKRVKVYPRGGKYAAWHLTTAQKDRHCLSLLLLWQ